MRHETRPHFQIDGGGQFGGIPPKTEQPLVYTAPNETERRKQIKVTVDEKGIAHGITPEGSVRTQLGFAGITHLPSGEIKATLIPLTQKANGEVQLSVAPGTEIAFITGYSDTTEKPKVVSIRGGNYPGAPFSATEYPNGDAKETPYELKGIKPEEIKEHQIASQLALPSLGFDLSRSRIISNIHISSLSTGEEYTPPIIIDTKGGEFHILTYTIEREQDKNFAAMAAGLSKGLEQIFPQPDALEGIEQGKELQELQHFFTDLIPVRNRITSLDGAFTVKVVPLTVSH